jgi:hypothetical protein
MICHIITFVLSPKDRASNQRGIGGSFPGVNQSKRKTDHSPPSSDEVNNGGAIPPLPVGFHGVMLN